MNNMKLYLSLILVWAFGISFTELYAQQDPQYTHYMYNTMAVNPAYAGSRGHAVITGLGRTQWVGFDGAPDSQTLSLDMPLNSKGLGLGINLVNDKLGPSHEMYLDIDGAYAVKTGGRGKLAFGLKVGGRLLNIDWAKGRTEDQKDGAFSENIVNKFLPTVGAGIYYYKPKWYLGLSVPNFLRMEHYDEKLRDAKKVAVERMHFFLIGGYVFNLSQKTKFKPAFLFKGVKGAPLILDVSANFLFNNKFRAGLAWRWDDSVSAMLGFQVNRAFHIGYGYDLTTTNYNVTNTGTHEILLRYEFLKNRLTMKSPRFF